MLIQKSTFLGMKLNIFAAGTCNINHFLMEMCEAAKGQWMYLFVYLFVSFSRVMILHCRLKDLLNPRSCVPVSVGYWLSGLS